MQLTIIILITLYIIYRLLKKKPKHNYRDDLTDNDYM